MLKRRLASGFKNSLALGDAPCARHDITQSRTFHIYIVVKRLPSSEGVYHWRTTYLALRRFRITPLTSPPVHSGKGTG
jgi:hypothetical protein